MCIADHVAAAPNTHPIVHDDAVCVESPGTRLHCQDSCKQASEQRELAKAFLGTARTSDLAQGHAGGTLGGCAVLDLLPGAVQPTWSREARDAQLSTARGGGPQAWGEVLSPLTRCVGYRSDTGLIRMLQFECMELQHARKLLYIEL